jgi:hypothetical protein
LRVMSGALRAETPVWLVRTDQALIVAVGPGRLPGRARPRSAAPTAMLCRRIRSPALLPEAERLGSGQQRRRPGSACVIRNAPRGPGQGALIVTPSGAEVPMGSLLSVIAVTVAVNAPAMLEGVAGERRRRPDGGHQQCRRHKRRFEQRSGVNAKHCSPPGVSSDSASQLRAIRSRGISHSGPQRR